MGQWAIGTEPSLRSGAAVEKEYYDLDNWWASCFSSGLPLEAVAHWFSFPRHSHYFIIKSTPIVIHKKKIMNIQLKPEDEQFIRAQIARGKYENPAICY